MLKYKNADENMQKIKELLKFFAKKRDAFSANRASDLLKDTF